MQSEYQIEIPKDENDYTHRVCPTCEYRFGVRSGPFPDNIFCPYCGVATELSEYNTPEQIAYATEEAKNLIFYGVQKDFQKMMKRTASHSKVMTFKSSHIRKKYTFPPQQSELPTDMICSSCENEYVIFGISAICPYCGREDVKILDANLATIENELNSDRELRRTYIDVVTAFQNECQYFAQDAKGVKFQNIESVVKHFKKSNIDILENVEKQNLLDIRTVFEKRHAGQHRNGTYDQKYVDALGLDQDIIGQKVAYSKNEIVSAVKALVQINNNLRTKYKNGIISI